MTDDSEHHCGRQGTVTTIAIVENDAITRRALANWITGLSDFAVLWEADTGLKALQLSCGDERWPDVMLVDMSLGDMPGTSVCRRVRATTAGCPLLAMTSFPIERYEREVADAGAQGIVLKSQTDRFRRALEAVIAGGTYPETGAVVFDTCEAAHNRIRGHAVPRPILSSQEAAVLDLLIDGHSYDEIGRMLHVKAVTVRTYMARAEAKLQASTQAQAAVRWMQVRNEL